jgi:beta-lactam-binding protein with PASTA domain
MRAIDIQPKERYESAASMLAELRALRDAMRIGQPTSVKQPAAVADEPEMGQKEVEAGFTDTGMRRTYLVLTALFLAVVIAVGAGTWLVMRPKGEIRVPPLLGKTWEEAETIARDAGIELVDDGRSYSDIYRSGTICAVMPPAGSTVPRDTPQVKVKISNGSSQVSVPDLKGMAEADANTSAAGEGFAIGKIRQEYSEDVPVNSVIAQDPEAGLRRPSGSSIDLVISQGPKPITEPAPEQPSATSGQQRRFNVGVEVPAEDTGSQQVEIKVDDDRGETTVYDESHNPGDKFTVTVATQGSSARIRVYVGGSLVSDATY